MATALQNGNLIVPVIKNADQLNLTGLTKQVNILPMLHARVNLSQTIHPAEHLHLLMLEPSAALWERQLSISHRWLLWL